MAALDPLACFIYAIGLFALSATITRGAIALGIMDRPNERSAHSTPTPRAGGLGPVIAAILGVVALQLADAPPAEMSPSVLGAIGACLAVTAVGLADDIRPLPARWRLVGQILAASLVVAFGFRFDTVLLPLLGPIELGPFGYPLTLLWIVGLTNGFNFMDGLDGQAGGVAALAGAWLALIALLLGDLLVFGLAATLSMGALGFTVFNFPRARVFLGDVGSQFFGFGFAVLGVMLAQNAGGTGFIVVPLLFAAFIADSGLTVWRRWRQGARLTEAHREHLFQLLHRTGTPALTITLVHWGMVMLQGIAAVLLVTGRASAGLLALLAAGVALGSYVRAGLIRGRQARHLPPSSAGTSRT